MWSLVGTLPARQDLHVGLEFGTSLYVFPVQGLQPMLTSADVIVVVAGPVFIPGGHTADTRTQSLKSVQLSLHHSRDMLSLDKFYHVCSYWQGLGPEKWLLQC